MEPCRLKPIFWSGYCCVHGGETGFPKLDINIPPKKGDVVVFHNTLLDDAATHPKINPRSLHGGMPVIKGEKWMVNLWFRENLRY